MFTYKFLGLDKADAGTPYYYGSLPVKPEMGHTLLYDQTGNRYAIVRIVGEGLVGNDADNQSELAWADINRGEQVPTLFLQKLHESGPVKPTGRSFTYEEMKEYSQHNRESRLSAKA